MKISTNVLIKKMLATCSSHGRALLWLKFLLQDGKNNFACNSFTSLWIIPTWIDPATWQNQPCMQVFYESLNYFQGKGGGTILNPPSGQSPEEEKNAKCVVFWACKEQLSLHLRLITDPQVKQKVNPSVVAIVLAFKHNKLRCNKIGGTIFYGFSNSGKKVREV